ncbi:hypothetical protein PFISCL1PPCAC_2303, partial [Pristionchus fissidentatus]
LPEEMEENGDLSNNKYEIPMSETSSIAEEEDLPSVRPSIARRSLIGPFSLLLTFSGLDLQRSLCGIKTQKCRSITSTVVFTIIALLFFGRFAFVMSNSSPSLSWGWGEANIIGFTAAQSFVALILLARWTCLGMYSQIYTELLRVKSFYSTTVVTSIHERSQFIGALVLGVFYILITLASSIKTSIYGRFSVELNGTTVMLHPGYFVFSMDNLFGAELVLGVWMAMATVLATASFVFIHAAVRMELTKYNEDLREAIDKKTLLDSLEKFNIRHIAILKLVSLLTDKLASFASFSTFTILIANVNALYLMSFMATTNAFSTVMCVLWMLCTGSLIFIILNPPATIQQLLVEATSLIVNHNELIAHPDKIALAQLMVTRNRVTPTRMAIMNAIVVNTHTPHLITLIVPLIVAVLSYARKFQQ